MKHTPGPWRMIDHDEDYIAITDAQQDFGICRIEQASNESRESMVASAHLIKAAPDLLEACKAAIDALADYENFTGHKKFEVDQIKKAIAKAKGE